MVYILILYGLTWISYKLTFHSILAPTLQTWFYNVQCKLNAKCEAQASDRFKAYKKKE